MFGREPALWIGTIASVVTIIVSQALDNGIITTDRGVSWARLILAVTPLIAAALIRGFVTPTDKGT